MFARLICQYIQYKHCEAEMKRLLQNKSLKPTVTRVTPFAEKAKPAPLYGGLVPPLGWQQRKQTGIISELLEDTPLGKWISHLNRSTLCQE